MKKRDGEFEHSEMYELPYILWQIIYIIENNFKFNNDEIKAEYSKLRKQLIKRFVECNTQDENEKKFHDDFRMNLIILYYINEND